MIDVQAVTEAIERMRRTGSNSQCWEAKESVVSLPKSLPETLSAFSNMNGGLILLGLSEKSGFHPTKGFDAGRIFSLMQAAGDQLTPPVRMEIEKVPFEGALLVAARVPAMPSAQKPCYITARGRYDGSFIRTGDGDRHLSPYEVDRLSEEREHPRHDLEPVEAASMSDLDPEALEAIVNRCRELFPRVFGRLPEETILTKLGVAVRTNSRLCPTLAGLLAAGIFPQQYFPRLEIVFTVFPGTTKAGDLANRRRYIDSREIVGSIPEMLLETMTLVRQRMNAGAVIDENGLRHEAPDYPLEAVREAVANALQHRDYSREGRGTHVQVNMYADRLEILNPGGLFGSTTVESLGEDGISSARNEYLSMLLTYTPYESGYVVENKGTGFMVIRAALEKARMPPLRIKNSLTFFRLTFEKRDAASARAPKSWKDIDKAILEVIRSNGSASVKELIEVSRLSRATIGNHLKKLAAAGVIQPTEPERSPKQRYRLAQPSPAAE